MIQSIAEQWFPGLAAALPLGSYQVQCLDYSG